MINQHSTFYKEIAANFPIFKLSYDIVIHKKVYDADIILAIPEGPKLFAWFTVHKKEQMCFLIELNKDKQIVSINTILTHFSDKIILGTIFYGTLFKRADIQYFSIEDIYYYSGKLVSHYSYLNKIHLLKDMFQNELSQIPLTNKHTIFGLPFMTNDVNIMYTNMKHIDYNIADLQFRYYSNRKILTLKLTTNTNETVNICSVRKNMASKPSTLTAVFKVTADIEPDIYNLFIYKDGAEDYYDHAIVPTYKLSVMMNKLFRNIKENEYLDAIEESDEEEEFEDKREDKFVHLDKCILMKCEYNYRFKRWMPIEVAKNNDKMISYSTLKKMIPL